MLQRRSMQALRCHNLNRIQQEQRAVSADNEVLWTVVQTQLSIMGPSSSKVYVFRTRHAARLFRAEKLRNKRLQGYAFKIHRAKWGPEQ